MQSWHLIKDNILKRIFLHHALVYIVVINFQPGSLSIWWNYNQIWIIIKLEIWIIRKCFFKFMVQEQRSDLVYQCRLTSIGIPIVKISWSGKMFLCWIWAQCVNSLGPDDPKWWQRSASTLAHVMACCLRALSHYLNQYWFTISKVYWHSFEYNFTRDTSAIIH